MKQRDIYWKIWNASSCLSTVCDEEIKQRVLRYLYSMGTLAVFHTVEVSTVLLVKEENDVKK